MNRSIFLIIACLMGSALVFGQKVPWLSDRITLGKMTSGEVITTYNQNGRPQYSSPKVLGFKVGSESWRPVYPFGKEIMAYMKKDKGAWEDFLNYRTNARIAYGAKGLVMVGALYTGIQMIGSDGELTTEQGVIGFSMMGAGFGLNIAMNAAAKSNIEKAVEHYNEAVGMIPEEKEKESICWSIRNSSFSAGLSLVGTF